MSGMHPPFPIYYLATIECRFTNESACFPRNVDQQIGQMYELMMAIKKQSEEDGQ